MLVTRNKIFLTTISCCFFRFIIFPLDDYPDIFFIYKEMIKNKTFFSIAEFFDFNKLFSSYSCAVIKPESRFLDYFFGGGFYKCDFFPISIDYINYFFLVSSVFLLFIFINLKLSSLLKFKDKEIFRNVILNLILLPSTTFFILSLHIDVPYHFLIISFVMLSFIMAFKKKVKILYPIFFFPFIVLRFLAPDNQAIIFIGLILTSLISIYLSKNNAVINLLDRLSSQINSFNRYDFKISKKVLINFFLFLGTIIFIIIFFRFKFLEFLADPSFSIFGEINKIASVYVNAENVNEVAMLIKYPVLLRLFGAIQGLIITTPFGIKPSIFSTFLFFFAFFIGVVKVFSLKSDIFPVFIKLFFISSVIFMILVLSIFPFFSYSKYWLFLLPFASLFLTFAPKLGKLSLLLIYLELILKSTWFSIY